MKKTLSVSAVLSLVSGVAFAQSTNSSVELVPGYNLVRTPFLAGTNSLDIQSVLDTSVITADRFSGEADQILLWDPVGIKYDTYFTPQCTAWTARKVSGV